MANYMGSTSAQTYVTDVNGKLYDLLLLHKQPIPAKAWLPSSPESSSPEKPAVIYKDPLPGTVPSRIGKFVYPPLKRLRRKTSDDGQASSSMPSAMGVKPDAAVSSLEACAQDAEAYLLAREHGDGLDDEDFGADEEAAAFMNA